MKLKLGLIRVSSNAIAGKKTANRASGVPNTSTAAPKPPKLFPKSPYGVSIWGEPFC